MCCVLAWLGTSHKMALVTAGDAVCKFWEKVRAYFQLQAREVIFRKPLYTLLNANFSKKVLQSRKFETEVRSSFLFFFKKIPLFYMVQEESSCWISNAVYFTRLLSLHEPPAILIHKMYYSIHF